MLALFSLWRAPDLVLLGDYGLLINLPKNSINSLNTAASRCSRAAGSKLCKRETRSKSLSIWCGLCPLGIGHTDACCLVEHVMSSSRVYGLPPLNSYPTWRCASTGPCPTPSPAPGSCCWSSPEQGSRKAVQLDFLPQHPLGHRQLTLLATSTHWNWGLGTEPS